MRTRFGRPGPPGRPAEQPVRVIAVDGGWAVAGAVFGLFGTRGAAAQDTGAGYRGLDLLAYVLVIGAPLLLAAVRVWPRAVMAATTVLVAVYLARDYPGGPIYLVTITAAAVLGWREPVRRGGPAVVATSVALVVGAALHLSGNPLSAALALLSWSLVALVPWALTALARVNRAASRQATIELRRRAADEERMQIARDVHDVVGHSLAVISMQAGVALHVATRRPEQAQVALEAIARSSREALAQLRSTLAVLRGEPAPTALDPGLTDLPTLVADFAAGGQPVRLSVTGDRELISTAQAVATYRIVQESLTNAARHARDTATFVEVACGPAVIVIDVCDDGPGANPLGPRNGFEPGGSGLAGMRARCVALGGNLEAGPRTGGGWRVHAELPRLASSA